MEKTVATVSDAVAAMSPDWELARTLMAGTSAMRAAGQKYLPKWPAEEDEAYNARLSTAVLYPAYSRTVITLAAKPFSKPVTIGDDVPPTLVEYCADIDLQGRNLDTFAADILTAALGEGLAGILVDHPTRPEGVVTLADERGLGLRPYAVQIMASQLLGWIAAYKDGKWQLLQLRFMETVEEADGPYAVRKVQQVRVLAPGKWETHRQNEKNEWVLHDEGTTTLTYVPFIPIYGQRLGFMMSRPPLIELAHLNVKHWQSQSDQDTILHVARVPILTARQCGDKFELRVGASSAVNLGDGPEAQLAYVEHTGAAIEAGKASLDDLKDEMRQAGAEMLVVAQVEKTATEAASENAVGMSALQKIAQGLEDGLDRMLQIFADWIGEKTGGHVELFDDYAIRISDATTQQLKDWVAGGLISKETAFRELQRRGEISPDLVWEEEKGRIDVEGPPLGTMTDSAGNGEGQ